MLARALADNPGMFARLGDAPGVTYLDRISDLSFGQLVETLATNRGRRRPAPGLPTWWQVLRTGTLFRLACSYGGTAGGVDHERRLP